MIKKNLLICFFLLILLSLFVNASSITYCEFEVLQDTKFENGFLETWLTNKQNIENRCSLNFGNKNPYWQLYEMSSYQHFCDNLPQDSSNSFPKILESEEFAWQYDPAWKISRNWDSDGGLWEEDDLWGTWVWYQKSPNSNIGTGWRVMHLHTPKQLILNGEGHARFVLDTSLEENRGCRTNLETGIYNPDDIHWWNHFGLHQRLGDGLNISDLSELTLKVSYKLNDVQFKNRCTMNDVYGNGDLSLHTGAKIGFMTYFGLVKKVDGNPYGIDGYLATPARFFYKPTGSGLAGHLPNLGKEITADTVNIPFYGAATNSSEINKLRIGEWVHYEIDVLKHLKDMGDEFNFNGNDYRFSYLGIITEPYAAGAVIDFEIKDLSLVAKLKTLPICNQRDGKNGDGVFYQSEYSTAYGKMFNKFPSTVIVNGETWHTLSKDWVSKPYYFDVKFNNYCASPSPSSQTGKWVRAGNPSSPGQDWVYSTSKTPTGNCRWGCETGYVRSGNNCVEIDDTPPSISASGASNSWFNTQRNATVRASDNGIGLRNVQYAWRDIGTGPGGNTANYERCSSTWGTRTTNGEILRAPAGEKVLYLCARDMAGNYQTWTGNYKWENNLPRIDFYEPDSTTATIPNTPLSVIDTGSGLKTVRYRWTTSSSNPSGITSSRCTGGTAISVTLGTTNWVNNAVSQGKPTTPGKHYLHVCAEDVAGNIRKSRFS